MRFASCLLVSFALTSCQLEEIKSQFSKKLDASQFSVTCESRTEEQYLGKPDRIALGFPEDAPYTEKYCSIFYEKTPWDGPMDSLNWALPISLTTVSSPNADGTPVAPQPSLFIYDLKIDTIRKGAVLMGIMGQWTGSDHIMSFEQTLKFESKASRYSVKYHLSPVDDDYVSVPTAPPEG